MSDLTNIRPVKGDASMDDMSKFALLMTSSSMSSMCDFSTCDNWDTTTCCDRTYCTNTTMSVTREFVDMGIIERVVWVYVVTLIFLFNTCALCRNACSAERGRRDPGSDDKGCK